ncbi:Tetratricopeptide repeat protein 7B [Thoreauomyces humboldtii]|nr:Tetratricopeptide repeat protein 7B [Thoreauomyces humboldtii]
MAPAPTPKFLSVQTDIDVYRYKGQWTMVEQRTKKKCAKHGPSGSSYEYLTIGESLLNTAMRHALQIDVHVDNGLANGGHIFLPLPEGVREQTKGMTEGAINYLKMAIDKAKADAGELSVFEIQQAHTIIAWAELQCGRTSEALILVHPFEFGEAETVASDVRPYTKVMLLAGLTVKAMALHMASMDAEAYVYSARAVAFYAKHSNTQMPIPERNRHLPLPDMDQWMRWFESSHHFHTLLAAKLGHTQSAIAAARTYVFRLKTTADKYQLFSKIAVVGCYLRLLAGVRADALPPLPLSGIPAKRIPSTISTEARTEMRQVLPYYETLVTTVLPFPRGEDVKPMEVERHIRVMESYDWNVFVETYTASDESLGDIADRHYRLIQSLYRGTKHTFHSMRMLRYMTHTFVSLISQFGDNMPDDEKTEAEAAMESYVFYWDKQYKARLEQDKKLQVEVKLERESMIDLRRSMGQLHTPPPSAVPTEDSALDEAQDVAARRSRADSQAEKLAAAVPVGEQLREQLHDVLRADSVPAGVQSAAGGPFAATVIDVLDGERIVDVVGVLLAGIRMLSHNSEGDEDKLMRAVGYADRAVELLDHHGSSCGSQLPTLQHIAYRALGVMCNEVAQEVRDSQLRREYQKRALDATKRAKQLNPTSWEVLYQRAMQLAEAGEISQGIIRIKESLEHNKTYAPSWNMLALLLGAKKEYAQALKVCEIGIKECIARAESTAIPSDILTIPGAASGVKWSWDAVDLMEKEDLLNLSLTQVAIEAYHLGPATALTTLKTIMTLARKLFGPVDFVNEASSKFGSGGDSYALQKE